MCREQMIKYIDDNINDLKKVHRQEILLMIVYSNIDKQRIRTKGDGTQILFNDIDDATIIKVYRYIKHKVENTGDII